VNSSRSQFAREYCSGSKVAGHEKMGKRDDKGRGKGKTRRKSKKRRGSRPKGRKGEGIPRASTPKMPRLGRTAKRTCSSRDWGRKGREEGGRSARVLFGRRPAGVTVRRCGFSETGWRYEMSTEYQMIIGTGNRTMVVVAGDGVVIKRRMKWREIFDWKESKNTRVRARQQLV